MVWVGRDLKAHVVPNPFPTPSTESSSGHLSRYFRCDKTSLLKYCIILQLFLIKGLCALSKEDAIVELMTGRKSFPTLTACRSTAGYPHWNLGRDWEGAQRSPGGFGTDVMDSQAVKSIRKIPRGVPQTGTSRQVLLSQAPGKEPFSPPVFAWSHSIGAINNTLVSPWTFSKQSSAQSCSNSTKIWKSSKEAPSCAWERLIPGRRRSSSRRTIFDPERELCTPPRASDFGDDLMWAHSPGAAQKFHLPLPRLLIFMVYPAGHWSILM